MRLEIEEFLDHMDEWKLKVHEELKGLSPADRKAYWNRIREEARARGLNVVEPEKPTKGLPKRARGTGGNARLDEAMAALARAQANLVQAQAASVLNQTAMAQHQTVSLARTAESDRINSERFARIMAMLLEHRRLLDALPDVICDKLGFRSPESQPTE